MFQATSPRANGVLTTSPERPSGQPRTITHFAPCQMVAIQYMDAAGQAHEAVVMKVGNKWFLPPNSEQWFGALREVSPWLAKQCEEQTGFRKSELPKEDTVDLFPSQSAEGA